MCKKWSHYNGWPTQEKKNGGLIVMGDLPRWKRGRVVSFLWVTYPGKKKNEVWSHCNGWPTQMERIWKSAVSLSWVTNPNGRCDMTSVKNRTYLAKSLRGWQKKGQENLVLPDNSLSLDLTTWCFLTARVENSRLPDCKVDLFISLGFS